MISLYDRADIYDLLENEERFLAYKEHWKTIFQGKDIKTMLDVSIGSGSVTLPVMDLGVNLKGSDLSEEMLKNCTKKAKASGREIELKCSDFRDLSCFGDETFDLVASTGNSLGYVDNEDILKTLEQMDKHVKKGGYLYFDSRNWEKIKKQNQRFFFYNPVFVGEDRVNMVQLWDYNSDGTMTFNIAYTFERDNQIFQKELFREHYHPFSKELAVEKLKKLGYENIEILCFPAQFPMVEFERIEWYSVMAKKA